MVQGILFVAAVRKEEDDELAGNEHESGGDGGSGVDSGT